MTERNEMIAGRLVDLDDEAAWRESRDEWERQRAEDLALDARLVTTGEMIAHDAAERAQVEGAAAAAHERQGWRRGYPLGEDAA